VGGPVRDLLLEIPLKDWDFTTNATPEQIIEITKELSSDQFSEPFYNNKFGTVGVPLVQKESLENFNQIIEITTMRKEGEYKDHRHPIEVGWTEMIEEDLARRDFTMNAMAIKLDRQQIKKLEEPLSNSIKFQSI
jgi:tRNA nucleotidyltransferase/poly(A) polymerase